MNFLFCPVCGYCKTSENYNPDVAIHCEHCHKQVFGILSKYDSEHYKSKVDEPYRESFFRVAKIAFDDEKISENPLFNSTLAFNYDKKIKDFEGVHTWYYCPICADAIDKNGIIWHDIPILDIKGGVCTHCKKGKYVLAKHGDWYYESMRLKRGYQYTFTTVIAEDKVFKNPQFSQKEYSKRIAKKLEYYDGKCFELIDLGRDMYNPNLVDEPDEEPKVSIPTPQPSVTVKPSQNTQYTPKCPVCGSPDITKLSVSKRVVSGAVWGLFSKTARSQWECRNCGNKW